MKYVRGFIALLGFNLLVAFAVYAWIPTYRYLLVEEDGLVESLSAAFYIFACVLGLLILKKRRAHKRLLVLVSALGLLGFLDELSFGERILGLSMPSVRGVSIDAAHDLFYLAYLGLEKLINSNAQYAWLLALIGAISVIVFFVFFGYRLTAVTALPVTLRQPRIILVLFFAVLVLFASVVSKCSLHTSQT